MRRSPSLLFCAALLAGCGGSIASSSSSDGGPPDTGATDTLPALDSAPPTTDSGVAPEVGPDAVTFDAPAGTAKVRLADLLETFSDVRVCLVDGKTGVETSLLPAGLSSISYEEVTAAMDVPAGDSLEVRVVKSSDTCDGTQLLGGALLADPILGGHAYTLGVFLSPGEGPALSARLWPDATAPSTSGMIRAFNTMFTARAIDVSIEVGTDVTVVFNGLRPGETPTSSTGGTPTPEGYVRGTDVLRVDLVYEAGPTIASFPVGFFGSGYMTVFAAGSPDGTPTRADALLCWDDIVDGPTTRCSSLGTPPP